MGRHIPSDFHEDINLTFGKPEHLLHHYSDDERKDDCRSYPGQKHRQEIMSH